jgi:hypothetical protein
MKKLVTIKSLDHPLAQYLKDDPVRPDIPHDVRVSANSTVFALQDEEKVSAMVCVKYQDQIPSNLDELMDEPKHPTVAVFYTIWSYMAGAGRDMILETRKWIEDNNPEITEFVTYSPKTEMARKFHLKNGASTYRENEDSVNYKY